MSFNGSFNGTENIIQNYCITFTHAFTHSPYSRIKNSFVIKAADVTMEKAKKVADILFPEYLNIKIESIENDENTLTPAEYCFIEDKLRGMLPSKEDIEKRGETEYDKYLLNLIRKMRARMDQFPVYHT